MRKTRSSFLALGAFALSACAATAPAVFRGPASLPPKTQLEMSPGQTYLGFMKSDVKPALERGDGVDVRIDERNFFSGVSPSERRSASADSAFLDELSGYLKGERKDSRDLLGAILLALTANDPGGWSKLSENGQAIATHFMAIYTAESDRHLAVRCESHPWEIDLAAATFTSVYVAETNQMIKNGKLANGQISDWYAKDAGGFGGTRRQRIALQQMISRQLESSGTAKAAVREIESVAGDTKGDVIQSVFEFLADCDGPAKLTVPQSKRLVSAFMAYMDEVKAEAPNLE